jgi:hypothetical protein
MTQVLDLFGDPVPANWGQRGRPEHVASQQNRNRVSMLVAAGWSNARIAAALYITVPTLRKHYFSELHYRAVARDRLNANMMTKLFELFMAGNVAAGREFRDLMRENDRMEIERSMAAKPKTDDEKQPRLGKKELDAQRAIAADADLMAELESEASGNAARH